MQRNRRQELLVAKLMALHLAERQDLPEEVRRVLLASAAIWENARQRPIKIHEAKVAKGNPR